jgi:hypothetical protein
MSSNGRTNIKSMSSRQKCHQPPTRHPLWFGITIPLLRLPFSENDCVDESTSKK